MARQAARYSDSVVDSTGLGWTVHFQEKAAPPLKSVNPERLRSPLAKFASEAANIGVPMLEACGESGSAYQVPNIVF